MPLLPRYLSPRSPLFSSLARLAPLKAGAWLKGMLAAPFGQSRLVKVWTVLVVSVPLLWIPCPVLIWTVSPGWMRATDSDSATDFGTQPPTLVLMKVLTHLNQGPGSSVAMKSTVLAA